MRSSSVPRSSSPVTGSRSTSLSRAARARSRIIHKNESKPSIRVNGKSGRPCTFQPLLRFSSERNFDEVCAEKQTSEIDHGRGLAKRAGWQRSVLALSMDGVTGKRGGNLGGHSESPARAHQHGLSRTCLSGREHAA